MGKIPFVTDNYRNNLPVNWYPAKDDEKGVIMFGTPGLTLKVTLGQAPIWAMRVVGDYLYVVAGDGLYRVDTSYTATLLGTVLVGVNGGPVFIEDDGFHVVVVVHGGVGYCYTISSGSFAAISFGFTPDGITYQDGYFMVSEYDNKYGKFWISDSYDPTTYDAVTGYAYPEGDSDGLVALLSDHRELWLFGKRTTEIWYNSGDTFPFTRNSAGFVEVGCAAKHTPASFDNSIVWLTNRGQLVRADGYTPKAVSTRKLEREWQGYSKISDAEGFSYVYEGHWFYHLTFPSAPKTWVFDGATGLWHERSSAGFGIRHRASCHALFNHHHIVGDYENGNLYEMLSDVYSDNGETITRVFETAAIAVEGNALFLPGLQIEFGAGETSLQAGQGSDPQAMLEWSDDGGKTWGNEHWVSIGKVGEYSKRAIWRRLGRSRDRVFRLTVTDPAPFDILGWDLWQPAMGRKL